MKTIKMAAIIILLLGIVGLGIGGAFTGIGFSKNSQIANYLRAEKVTLGLSAKDVAQGKVVDNLTTAQNAAQLLTTHRQKIAPTYNDLLGGQPYDPTNVKEATYAQAMNLQTNIYTAVLAFGLAQSIMANGAFMIATGIAFIAVALVLFKMTGKPVEQ